MGFHNFVNTAQFSYTARDFKKQGDRYCLAPVGSKEWVQWWEEEERRCSQGYSVGGLWIPGRHYHYLNFAPIMKVDDAVAMKMYREARSKVDGKMNKTVSDRIMGFPRFYEIDYEWYRFKDIAWNGGTFMGVNSTGGKHMVCGKTRGAGFSYKEAQDGVYNYTFIDGSKSYYFASTEQYLTTDGILNKVQPMLDFTNDNCIEWKKNRQKKNTLLYQRASYIDGKGVERGSFSEIIGITVDDPDKTRGKRGRKIVFEEAGSFKNLKTALNVSIGSIQDGDITVGQISVFGTGGEEGADIEGLEDIFQDPASFDMLEFPNVWEKGYEGTSCGYFVPVWRTKSSFMDVDGNVDIISSIQSEKEIRAKKKKAKDPKVLDGYKAEYPFIPGDMFKRLKRNMFDSGACRAQIRRIESQSSISGMLRYGELIRSEIEGVILDPMPKQEAKPVEQYPHGQKDELEGCVVIAAAPYRDAKGKVPEGIYQICVDPYYKEESEDLTSLFSMSVWKQYNQIDPVDEGLPIAWCDCRTQQIETAYKRLFMLADMYNCTIQSEIAGGGQGIVDYARMTRQLHKLESEPEMMHNKEYSDKAKQKNKSLFMNMPTEKKRLGLTYLANWAMQQRGATETGNPILNIHRIYWVGLLREMEKYGDKNADRVSASIVAMFMLKENAYREEVRAPKPAEEFATRMLFGGDEAVQEQGMTTYY